MEPFNFYLPTKIIFGNRRIENLPACIPAAAKKLLLVTDTNAASLSGAMNTILSGLKEFEVEVFDQVEENPSFETINRGRDVAISFKADLIIGLGGGSPMDAAKGIALLSRNETTIPQILEGCPLKNDPLPIICIPTTSGTGSEVTPYAVFTDTAHQNKCGYAHSGLFPACSIIDPELTFSMPRVLVINTGLDALTHAVEAYLSTLDSLFIDHLALVTIEMVIQHLGAAAQKNQDAMAYMAYAAMAAGICITHSGTILPHIMGYPLTLFHQIPHGKASAILLPRFMQYLKEKGTVPDKIERLQKIFSACDGLDSFLAKFEISTDLSSYGVKAEEIPAYVKKTIVKGDVHITPAPVTEQDIADIYNLM